MTAINTEELYEICDTTRQDPGHAEGGLEGSDVLRNSAVEGESGRLYESSYGPSWKKLRDALHVIIRHHPLPLHAAALLMGLGVRHCADPCEGEKGLQAAVGAQHDVRVQAVAHHQAAVGVHGKLGGHAVEHEVVGGNLVSLLVPTNRQSGWARYCMALFSFM
ncbi:hypothetical protein FQN60_003387 [Etheostoma spectabile]|uniref:Uncharacterized protein n=1 Tax=Etheostoma spectabile TaxID=54343 RepID=A0A5J5CME3_9PERO|nr:hypothetical protein FQN60_003387 [Etheostoma spectabile]